MAWFWTDDLARLLEETGARSRSMAEFVARPAAIAAPDLEAAMATLRRMAGLTAELDEGTDAA